MSDEREREFGELKAKVDDLMRWRDVFESDIKESLKSLDSKIDREMRDMNGELRAIRQEIREALKVAYSKFPTLAKWIIGILFTGVIATCGWIVEWSLFHH